MDGRAIGNSLYGFTKGEACLTNRISIFVEMMGASDEGRATCVVCLDLSKFFHVARLERYGLNRQNKGLCWVSSQHSASTDSSEVSALCFHSQPEQCSGETKLQSSAAQWSFIEKGGARLEVAHWQDERQ